ncbi:MAG: nucleoside transporter C-terminal domain-containing protein [Planctomycetota bacterium]|nr:nucleoside transporter C-terminal domain-containing protein [Planctomycetota bacterium]
MDDSTVEYFPRMVSALGLVVMMLIAWALGRDRNRVDWRIVIGGLLLQLVLAVLVMRTAEGNAVFAWVGSVFAIMLDFVDEGSSMVFGDKYSDFFFAFKVLPTIIFFSSLMAVLYYLNLIQPVVRFMAWLMRISFKTSGAETLAVSANVFVGQTEAPLVVRPYVPGMTLSELMALMVGGFATISGGILAAYIGLGIDPTHLVSASVISAPAALVIAKILQPETDTPETLGQGVTIDKTPDDPVNVVDAAARGASDGLMLALNVGAMLIAFLALMALVQWLFGITGEGAERLVNLFMGEGYVDYQWRLEAVLGWLFSPLAWLMGIHGSECMAAGELLGYKLVANEFVAYEKLATLQKSSEMALSQRTEVILTYALCGFANFGSIGIQLAGIGGIAPTRRSDLAKLGVRAMIGGTLAAFMTACFAGMLYGTPWSLLG